MLLSKTTVLSNITVSSMAFSMQQDVTENGPEHAAQRDQESNTP